MTEMVLPQLIEAEAQLAAEEAALSEQLAEIQEKIKGIQTVISMFDGGGGIISTGDVATASTVAATEEPAAKVKVTPAVTTKTKGRGRPKKTETASKGTTKKKTAAKKTTATKAKGRGKASNWQGYIREDFSKTPLPDIVENILKAQPKSVFKIAAVMSEIFPDDMPKNHFLKARNRISNILSAGARSGEWHRGRGGTYSCSKAAVK